MTGVNGLACTWPAGAVVLMTTLLTAPRTYGEVMINEIRVAHPGADVNEYFELTGAPGESLDGLTYIVIGDSGGGLSGVIEHVSSLDGFMIDGSGFFLAGDDAMVLGVPTDMGSTLNFEDSDNVTHLLVTGFSGSLNLDLDVDDDCVLDVTPWSAIVDMIALVEEDNPPLGTECHYGPPSIAAGIGGPGHIYRCAGTGSWQAGDFDLGVNDTPGAPNQTCSGVCSADTNGDLAIDVRDLVNVIIDWGCSGECPGDVNGDATVDVNDLSEVILAWGDCT